MRRGRDGGGRWGAQGQREAEAVSPEARQPGWTPSTLGSWQKSEKNEILFAELSSQIAISEHVYIAGVTCPRLVF